MTFSESDLRKFANWESVTPGFNRNVLEPENRAMRDHIKPLIHEITSSGDLVVRILEDGGLTNYFGFFVYSRGVQKEMSSPSLSQEIPGVLVLLSLLAPVGVFGRSQISATGSSIGWSLLEPTAVSDPAIAGSRIEEALINATKVGAYRFLSPSDIAQPLPDGIIPYEYCLCDKPWDRVFHVLFSNTD